MSLKRLAVNGLPTRNYLHPLFEPVGWGFEYSRLYPLEISKSLK
jgi:hypothetical protein